MHEPANPHFLLVGASGSGKTWFAKKLSFSSRRDLIVFDPNRNGGWRPEISPPGRWRKFWGWRPEASTTITHTPEDFLDAVDAAINSGEGADVVVDEGSEIFGAESEKRSNAILVTQGRHFGLRMIILAQGYSRVPPVIRENCATQIVFAAGAGTHRYVREEWQFHTAPLDADETDLRWPVSVGEYLKHVYGSGVVTLHGPGIDTRPINVV